MKNRLLLLPVAQHCVGGDEAEVIDESSSLSAVAQLHRSPNSQGLKIPLEQSVYHGLKLH